MSAKRRNLHIYPSTFEFEARMERISETLAELKCFDEVVFVGVHQDELAENSKVNAFVRIERLKPLLSQNRQDLLYRLLRFVDWSRSILWRYSGSRADCINAHSLSALPVAYFLSILTHARLIYEPHELETETHSVSGIRRVLARVVERLFIHRASDYIFVSDSIADWYVKRYRLKGAHVVRNVSSRKKESEERTNVLREKFSIGAEELICIHQGQLGKGRGIEVMLETFADGDENLHLVLVGFGGLVDEIKDYAEKHRNIHYHEAVDRTTLRQITGSADVGLHLIQNSCLNHYYCLPNKIFEYLQAGIPVIISDFPEMAKVVCKHQCGWLVDGTVSGLKKVLGSLSKNELISAGENCGSVLDEYCWERERVNLEKVYDVFVNGK